MKSLLEICAVFLSVLAPVLPTLGQQNASGTTPTFRSRTSLVLVPVVVSQSGHHVEGLKESDFRLFDNGSQRTIASFEEVKVTPAAAPPRSLGPGVFSNAAPNDQPQRLMVLALDLLNTPFQKQSFSREALVRFLLGRPDANEPVMLVALTPDGLRVIHHFTADPANLAVALRRMKSILSGQDSNHAAESSQQISQDAATLSIVKKGATAGVEDAENLSALLTAVPRYAALSRDQDRTTETLRQIQQLARSLAGVPGRKSLIWVTGGLSFFEYLPDPMAVPDRRNIAVSTEQRATHAYEVGLEFERTWAMLSDASVAVYPIDVAEVTVPSFTEAMYQLPHHMGSALLKSQAMSGMTDNTGGSYCQLQATLENCFRDAMQDSAHYYLLSFYADRRSKVGWHKLQVRTNRKGVHLRSRTGYFQENLTPGSAATPSYAINQALSMPLDATGLLMTVRWLEPPQRKGGHVAYELFVDPNSIGFGGDHQNNLKLSVMVATTDGAPEFVSRSSKLVDANLTAENQKKVSTKGFLYRDALVLPENTKAVRFLVRDETSGRVGTLTVTP